ncbi:MAG: hypothetical protein R3C61_07120 [Bacteroidia bacterium]
MGQGVVVFDHLNPHNDLGCEDWRSRDRMWDYTRHADIFNNYLFLKCKVPMKK